ncbi:MAG: hypothetical protein HY974_01325 [Candidatus Kerfeldbacteria bacterium]|nr:hypothetical protein [Candidatus Kerfeldbacteria bacterium]
MPKFDITPPELDPAQELGWKIRDLLVGAGWTETLSYSFVGAGAGGELELENPVDKTKQFLRPSLLSSFKEQFEAVRRAGSGTVKLFELGRVFSQAEGQFPTASKGSAMLPAQPWHLVLAVNEPGSNNFRLVKGALDVIQAELGITLTPTYTEISPGYCAEVDLETTVEPVVREFKPLPKFPSIKRDLSVVAPGTSWGKIEEEIRGFSPLVDDVKGIDVYEVRGSGSSTTATISFRSSECTLKSEEVDAEMARLIKLLQAKFKAIIR